jgi:hypothetical protein
MVPTTRSPTPARVDHAAADRVRTDYWVERLRRLGPAESLRVADELWRQVRTLRSDWPDREERAADLSGHLALLEALSRAHRRSG